MDKESEKRPDMVNRPPHYMTGKIEVIDFIEDQKLDYHLGNVVKYICRSPHKGREFEDLSKAQWYLMRAIEKRVETQKCRDDELRKEVRRVAHETSPTWSGPAQAQVIDRETVRRVEREQGC